MMVNLPGSRHNFPPRWINKIFLILMLIVKENILVFVNQAHVFTLMQMLKDSLQNILQKKKKSDQKSNIV